MKNFLFTTALLLLAAFNSSASGKITTVVLDSENEMVVAIGNRIATTFQFPRPVNFISGYGLTDGREPGFVHFSAPKNSNLITVRSLGPDYKAYMTVLCGKEMYVFRLVTSEEPLVAVKMIDLPPRPNVGEITVNDIYENRLTYNSERLSFLIRKAISEPVWKSIYPEWYQGWQKKTVNLEMNYGEAISRIKEVHRFKDDDVFVFIAEVENKTDQPIEFDPLSFQIQVGKRQYPVTFVNSPEYVQAKGKTEVHLVLKGDIDGTRANLSLDNEFRLIMPATTTLTNQGKSNG